MTRPSLVRAWRHLPCAIVVAALAACGGGSDADPAFGNPDPQGNANLASSPPSNGVEPPANGAFFPDPVQEHERAEPLALDFSCPLPAYATPKVAAYDMSRDTSVTRQSLLSRFGFVIVNVPYTASDATANGFGAGIKALNPGTRIAQYINFPDASPSALSSEYDYALANALTVNR